MMEMQNSDGFARVKDSSTGSGCLVMTLLGESLDDMLNRTTLNTVDMKRIAYQCILRLKELHDRGYVHRDIKP
jgi:serine/threonine protein kinase